MLPRQAHRPSLMSPELAHAAPQCNNLPTPTGIAASIIALAQDLDAELGAATRLIGQSLH